MNTSKDFYYTQITRRDIDLCKYSYPVAAIHQILGARGFPLDKNPIFTEEVHKHLANGYVLISDKIQPEGTLQFICYKEASFSNTQLHELYTAHKEYWAALATLGLNHNDLSFEEWQISTLKKEQERLKGLHIQMIERAVNPPVMFATNQQTLERQYEVAQKNIALGRKGMIHPAWLILAATVGALIGMWAK